MLLRNYDNILVAKQLITNMQNQGDTSKPQDDKNLALKNISGLTVSNNNSDTKSLQLPFVQFCNYSTDFDRTDYYNNKSSLVCGSGTNPVNYDDYTMAIFSDEDVTRANTDTYIKPVYNEEKKLWSSQYSTTISVKKADGIDINEIGVLYSSGNQTVLVYRELLSSPIHVDKGANFILTFTVEVPSNPNKPANYSASAQVVTE